MEYGFKSDMSPSAPQEIHYPTLPAAYSYPPAPVPVPGHNPCPYPLVPPEGSPCSHSTNFRPIDPLNEYRKAYFWVDMTPDRELPTTALFGGLDVDGAKIYVGRAYHEGDWIPAKVIPSREMAYISYNGEEIEKEQFQVLCEQRFEWVPTHGGQIPKGAVEGGRTSDGEPLYVGRVIHLGSQTVGKVHPSHNCCYIPFDGEELSFENYEILVIRSLV